MFKSFSFKWVFKRKNLITIAVILCVCFLVYQLLSLKELNVQMSISNIRSGLVDKHHKHIASDDHWVQDNDNQILNPISGQELNQIEKNVVNNDKTIGGQNVIIIGILPQMATHYQKTSDEFQCISSGERIPYHYINDDYCDCEDESDEPSTNACPNTKFYCKTKTPKNQHRLIPSYPFITSYKVNDGICDCIDGSDEWSTNACPHHQY